MWLGVVGVAVRGMGNPVRAWMGSCLGRALINETAARARKRKAVRPAIRAKPHYAPFPRDLVRGGRAARGPNSAAAAAAASLEVEVAGRRRE